MAELLKIFQDIFGPEFLDNTVFEVTNWAYDESSKDRRKQQNEVRKMVKLNHKYNNNHIQKDETSWTKDLNDHLHKHGLNPSKEIPAVFIDR